MVTANNVEEPGRSAAAASEPAGKIAVGWLERAATRLGLPGIPAAVDESLGEALPLPWGDSRYASNALVPGRPPLEVSFVEADPDTLRLDFEPCGPNCAPDSRRDRAAALICQWTRECFDRNLALDLERSLAGLCRQRCGPSAAFGAFLGARWDQRGLAEAKIYCELAGALPQGFAPELAAVASAALSSVSGLTPHFASLACGRRYCSSRLYFLCRDDVNLSELRYGLAAAGLEHRLPELAAATIAISGGNSVLPGGTAVLSFREGNGRISCKLELLVRALPISQNVLARQLEMLVSERAGTRARLHQWSRALGGEDLFPGTLTVVGLRASATGPARLGLYVSPTHWSAPCRP